LLVANLFIINQRAALSILFLALSTLSKFFSVLLVPVFLRALPRRAQPDVILSEAKDLGSSNSMNEKDASLALSMTGKGIERQARGIRWIYVGLFAAVVIASYVPYSGAGHKLLDGLAQYASGWENNDSLFRLLLLAGNTKPQAGLIVGVFLAALVLFALKQRMELLRASLFLIAGLLLLSPNAFPWYFTWSIPFLCFYPNAPWLLMSITCVLGYSPLIAYTAGGPYRDSPLILVLEYVPVLAWLAYLAWRETRNSKMETRSSKLDAELNRAASF